MTLHGLPALAGRFYDRAEKPGMDALKDAITALEPGDFVRVNSGRLMRVQSTGPGHASVFSTVTGHEYQLWRHAGGEYGDGPVLYHVNPWLPVDDVVALEVNE